jgi:Tol biopolymer transport system component
MSLTPGTRLGVYEVIAPLGAGGMGEVYRARDTQLKRDVALKILPAGLAVDADRLARFQREAEILASLNHTNVAHLYGLADADGVRALVMELVDGSTLAERISQGPLLLDEALVVARQIAEALETAHERGIIHRDLKPANVKLTPDGVVKVLDFGLAKAFDAGGSDAVAASPTITSPAMTRAGVIMGTAAYMSPEQARGRSVDARTDIWAFGCVVFEMLSGRSPFDGETITDVLGAIVHKEPDWTKLPPDTPERLRRLLQRCLAKDAKQRLHNIADARLEIEDVLAARRSGVAHDEPAHRDRPPAGLWPREVAAWSLAALSISALIVIAWLASTGRWFGPRAAEPAPLRLSIVHTEGNEVIAAVISPDGRRVAYPARRADGMPVIWIRDLTQSTPRALPGTEGGNRPFWSPDSKQIGFAVGAVLKRMSADGGPVQEIVRGVRAGASWGAGDVVVYHSSSGQIKKVSASGGTPTEATQLQGPDWDHIWPSLLPDGRHFLFTAKHWAGLAEAGAQGIYLGSIDAASGIRHLLPDLTSAVYTRGHIVFARDGQLMAAPFDLASGSVTGEPTAIGEAVAGDRAWYMAAVSAAADGTLAIRPPPAPVVATASGQTGTFDGVLGLLRRDGSVVSRFGASEGLTYFMAVSPDGRSVVASLYDTRTSSYDLWRFDLATGARMALTSMRTTGGYTGSPVWSPDGTRLAYGCQPRGILDDVCIRDMQTGAVTTAFDAPKTWEHPRAWSPDGQYLLVNHDAYSGSSRPELQVLSMKTKTLSPFVATAGNVQLAEFSPDGHFVAFSSSETGRFETYVTTFPERRQTWPLTTDGGQVLSWRADSKEILVATMTGHIAAYPVSITGGTFSAGSPQVLIRNVGFDAEFTQATRDHSQILIRLPKDADKDKGEIRLLFGWARTLK